jgi:GGDEF domain-containing protein
VTLIVGAIEPDDAAPSAEAGEVAALRRTVIAAVAAALRGGDIVGSIDGGTFAVLLPGADASQSAAVTERMRRGIAQAGVTARVTMSRVTDSLGAHSFGGDGSRDLDRLLAHALAGLPRPGFP